MEKNKTGKYFKYALGEIILVVIGILIALQINNWNENRKERKTERTNLIALQEEFKQNLAIIDETILLNTQIISGVEKMIQSYSIDIMDTISEQTIAIYTYEALGREINFAPNTGVLTEMLSSGDLKLVQNSVLKHRLAGFGSWIDRMEQQEKEVYQYRMNIANHMTTTGNYKKIYTELGMMDPNLKTPLDSAGNKSILSSITFLNKLVLFKSASQATTINLYNPLKMEIEEILGLINTNLKILKPKTLIE